MTEFEYDCYKKKSVARSASRRKCGSKSKKCSLTTDKLTDRQWSERCGDVVSYSLNKPLNWKEFSKLPSDLKEEYMNSLIEKYSANARSMADMFGVSVATVFRVVKNENLNVKFLKGRYPSGVKEQEFKHFLDGELAQPVVEDEPANVENGQPKGSDCTPPTMPKNKTRLDSITMNFSGEIDIEMIANSLRYILGTSGTAKIQIICELGSY